MPPHVPTALSNSLPLRDIPALPIFAYVPSATAWVVVALLLILIGWLILRSPRRQGVPPGDALQLVEAEIERCLARGIPREVLFAVSRDVKVLLRTRKRGDFTADTPGELRCHAGNCNPPELGRVLTILAHLDESKYRPDATALDANLRELRGVLRPLVAPAPPLSRGEGCGA